MNKVIEPVTDTIKGTSKRVTQTMMGMSEYAYKAIRASGGNVLERL